MVAAACVLVWAAVVLVEEADPVVCWPVVVAFISTVQQSSAPDQQLMTSGCMAAPPAAGAEEGGLGAGVAWPVKVWMKRPHIDSRALVGGWWLVVGLSAAPW